MSETTVKIRFVATSAGSGYRVEVDGMRFTELGSAQRLVDALNQREEKIERTVERILVASDPKPVKH